MKNSEHLILFMLGVVTLGITFLLLFALGGMNPAVPPVVEQAQISVQQAAAVPLPQTPAPSSMEALDREVEVTFAKAAAYLGRSTFEEKEHIALLERLEFYRGLSSIRPERKTTAQDLIKDMELLLTLKESVARHVKLSGQINAAVTDAQIHLADGAGNEAAAQKIMNRIKSLYAISGLSEDQNRKLRASLAALKRAYKANAKSTASAPARSAQADIPESLKPYINKSGKAAPTKPVVTKPSAVKSEVKSGASEVTQKVYEPEAAPKARRRYDPGVPFKVTAPVINKEHDPQATKEYNKTMTKVLYYMQLKQYDKPQNDRLLDEMHVLLRSSNSLSEHDRSRLKKTIISMEQIGMARGFKGAWGK